MTKIIDFNPADDLGAQVHSRQNAIFFARLMIRLEGHIPGALTGAAARHEAIR